MEFVIIGGVAGGMSAATRLRRLDEEANITVVERSGHVSFANCGLPYYVGGVIEEREDLLLQTPERLKARFGLDVLIHTSAEAIDRDRRRVLIRDLRTGEERELAYDALVLSPGASPIVPPIPGIERALPLRIVEDADRLELAGDHGRSATVIGGGFIGVELAENLVHKGLDVTLVEATDQVMAPLDPEMAGLIHGALRDHGVDLVLSDAVAAIDESSVTLSSGRRVPADVVVAAIGVRPEDGLARAAGLEIAERGGIVIDDQMRTSDPAIYALGDAATKRDALDGQQTLVPLAGPANRQGRLVADVITGRDVSAPPVLGTAIVGLFGLQVASSGWNEKRLRAAGRPYRAIHTHPSSHAGYYPGAEPMALKLLVDPASDAILGIQGIGRAGVDKRIDVVATAMRGHLTASDLADLELAYAPQFSSAKDPVNMLGWVARNERDGLIETIQWHELAERLAAGASLIDVRTQAERDAGAIPGSIHVPIDGLREHVDDLPGGELIVYCAAGLRGYVAARTLLQLGRRAINLDGGYATWSSGVDTRGMSPAEVR